MEPPFADVGGRMAVFGRLFGDRVGVSEPGGIRAPRDVVALVASHLPPSAAMRDEAPVFEAAAFLGEWLRARAGAQWIAEGPYEPHLQVTDATKAIVYLIPFVSNVRTASTAGYDGLAPLLERVLAEVESPHGPTRLEDLPILPPEERSEVVAWIRENLPVREGMRAALWRRCSSCARVGLEGIEVPTRGEDWDTEAGVAASYLARRPFRCECGGQPGEVARFVMVREVGGVRRLGEIYMGGNHTRVSCWTLKGEVAEPLDALALAHEGSGSNG